MLRESLSHLSADRWGCVPKLLVVCPKAVSALETTGCLTGSRWPLGGLTPTDPSPNCCSLCLCPHSEPQLPPPLQETLQHQQPGLAQCLMRSLLFALGPGANETLCAPSRSGVSVSFSPVEVLDQTSLAFKARFSGDFSSHCQTPQAGKPDMGLRNFTPVV